MEKLILEIRSAEEAMNVMERRLLCELVGKYAMATRIGVSAWRTEDALLKSERSTELLKHLRTCMNALSDISEELMKK